MLKFVSFVIVLGFGSGVFASGCDSNYFQNGSINSQLTIEDFGQATAADGQKLIENMAEVHHEAIHYKHKRPVLNRPSNMKLIKSTYYGLDTDCGWSKFGSIFNITHLEIKTEHGVFYYPDVYKDIAPEFLGNDEYIEIEWP